MPKYFDADSKQDAEDKVWESDAYQTLPSGLCATCSGYGQPWSCDCSGDWEVDSV